MDERILAIPADKVMWVATGAFAAADEEQRAILRLLLHAEGEGVDPVEDGRAVIQRALEFDPPLLTGQDLHA
ncbi:hypothetical protein [Streptacidiphilus sp. MAP5-3]|uniref:hypothetical protein n=1 Tax=unclassified Streptacidiphilus TaxID=2643834 RepID=UPI00351904FB